eukprot:733651-Hanusia_phi.AAC.1
MQNVQKENSRLLHEIAKVKEEARMAINQVGDEKFSCLPSHGPRQATTDCEKRLSTYESALSGNRSVRGPAAAHFDCQRRKKMS